MHKRKVTMQRIKHKLQINVGDNNMVDASFEKLIESVNEKKKKHIIICMCKY